MKRMAETLVPWEEEMKYRKLGRYKYQLESNYTVPILEEWGRALSETPWRFGISIEGFVYLREGSLTIISGYSWDGTSGLPELFDNRIEALRRGSLVHDALYQLMREKHLDYRNDREMADKLMQQICLEDGLHPALAWLIYTVLRRFGEFAARPK